MLLHCMCVSVQFCCHAFMNSSSNVDKSVDNSSFMHKLFTDLCFDKRTYLKPCPIRRIALPYGHIGGLENPLA
jgi:hypothetical protein